MDEHLAAGQRATPDAWYRAAAPQPAASPFAPAVLAAPAVGLTAAPSDALGQVPVIDWTLPRAQGNARNGNGNGNGSNHALPAAPAAWQSRFVNHLGASAEKLNPNAGLQVRVPATTGLSRL
jgi:hypothetical protein